MKPLSRFVPSLLMVAILLVCVTWFVLSLFSVWVFALNIAIIFYCGLRHEFPRVMRFFGMGIVHCLNLAIVILGGWRPTLCHRRLHWTKTVTFRDGTDYDYLRPTWDAAAEQESMWRYQK